MNCAKGVILKKNYTLTKKIKDVLIVISVMYNMHIKQEI